MQPRVLGKLISLTAAAESDKRNTIVGTRNDNTNNKLLRSQMATTSEVVVDRVFLSLAAIVATG